MNNEIIELLKSKQLNKARIEILKLNEADIAETLEEIIDEINSEKAIVLFRMLPKVISAEVFQYLSSEIKLLIVEAITDKETQNIIDDLYFDDMIDLLEELPANIVKRVLSRTDKEKRTLINQFLNYPDDSAGSIMTIEYVGLKKEMTVKEALEFIRTNAEEKVTIYTCYVMNSSRTLEGIVTLRELVIADETQKIEDIMDTEVIYVNTYDDQEEVSQVFKKYDFMTLPVVDREERLTGIITFDDVVDVIEQENTEDFQKMAAMEPSEKEYLDTSVLVLAKKRIVWLFVLMGSAIITQLIISEYEEILSQVVILVAFMPMIMGTGGNSGAQSSTLIIRGMALNEIEMTDLKNIVWKELRVGLVIGVVLGAVTFARVYYFNGNDLMLTITVSLTLFLVIVLAKLIGGSLPIIAKALRLDPAIMAGPMITSLIDALSVVIYFALAVSLLNL